MVRDLLSKKTAKRGPRIPSCEEHFRRFFQNLRLLKLLALTRLSLAFSTEGHIWECTQTASGGQEPNESLENPPSPQRSETEAEYSWSCVSRLARLNARACLHTDSRQFEKNRIKRKTTRRKETRMKRTCLNCFQTTTALLMQRQHEALAVWSGQ